MTTKIKLENFDELFVGHPKEIEKNLKKLLPEAKSLENKSIYLQILSQISLAQAVQKKFKLAHKTLDKAEKLMTANYPIARARILLERGRVYHQSYNMKSALPYFLKSYEFSKKHKLDEHMSNAAHMIAAVVKNINDKIKWHKKTIAISNKSKNQKVRNWAMIEYSNLGNNYIQAKKYKEALNAYKRSLKLATKKRLVVIALGSQWGIARSLRSLNAPEEALAIQLELLEKYNELYKKGVLPIELLRVTRGQVYAELAELYLAKTKKFAEGAYQDLSKDAWSIKLEPKKIERMNRLRKLN